MASKLDALLAKQKKIDDQVRLMQAAEKEKERKADTRRLILQGRAAERLALVHPNYQAVLNNELNRLLTKSADRELFGLPPPPQPPGNPGEAQPESTDPQA